MCSHDRGLINWNPNGHQNTQKVHIEPVELPLGKLLYVPGVKMDYIYFPSSALISLIYELENGSMAEIAMVGNEGMIGVHILMGSQFSSSSAVVQSAGLGYKIKSTLIQEEFNRHSPVMNLFLRYIYALITQLSQISVCNRHHTLDRRFCRS